MTPLVKIDNFYLKREDLNTTGSVKDRAIQSQVQNLTKLKYHSAVISSTGNAAISAQHFCQIHHIPLVIFVSPHTHPNKLKLLSNFHISDKPISDAIKYAKLYHAYLLRQSTDQVAIDSYGQIANEIIDQLPSITSIYFPVGSGATLVGVGQKLSSHVKIIATQSAFNPTITKTYCPSIPSEKINLTDALTVRYLPLKSRLTKLIAHGLTVPNSQITTTQKKLNSQGVHTSNEGAMALAAFLQDPKLGGKYPVILFTGTNR